MRHSFGALRTSSSSQRGFDLYGFGICFGLFWSFAAQTQRRSHKFEKETARITGTASGSACVDHNSDFVVLRALCDSRKSIPSRMAGFPRLVGDRGSILASRRENSSDHD